MTNNLKRQAYPVPQLILGKSKIKGTGEIIVGLDKSSGVIYYSGSITNKREQCLSAQGTLILKTLIGTC